MIKQIFLVMLVLLTACNSQQPNANKKEEIITVSEQPLTTTLFFSGVIQPLKTLVVTSPAEGVIEEMNFHYGDNVKSSQFMFTISSEKFKSDYKTALMQYIKAKNEFTNSKSQLTESQFLHKNQLISDDDYRSKQTMFYSSQLTLVQAQDVLSAMLKQLNLKNNYPYQLSINEIDKITKALNIENNSQKLKIRAPRNGVALLSTKNSGDEIKKIEKGDQVKQGDILAVIGDVSGFTVRITVNEFNINQIKLGQKVKVTGAAFPDFVLEGEISGIDHQGQASQGGLPVFPVEILVPKLTLQQQAIIHIGMSAKVEITTSTGENKITLPFEAIIEKNGMTFVKVQDSKSKKFNEQPVKTGVTTENGIVISSNLKAGDKVLVTY